MKIVLISGSKKRNPADLFVSGFYEKESPSKEFQGLEPEFSKTLKGAVDSGRLQGKFAQTLVSFHPSNREASEVMVFGLGLRKNHRKKCMRKAAGQILSAVKARKAKRARILIDSFVSPEVSLADAVENFTETAYLAAYDFDKYKSKKEDQKDSGIDVIELLTLKGNPELLEKKMAARRAIAEGVLFARNLINEPANVMTPQQLAKSAWELARKKKLTCRILQKAELQKLGMGGILAVNRGSRTPPALIILEHGARHKSKGTVCLVGKGVTFDTGGISIKPAKDMEKMKYDMSGAAAVIAAMGVLADLKVPRHVVALAPAVENMVAEDPQRPGDIIKMYNGKTVEVLNTDAEGRLILGDALAYAEKYHPKAILDAATLTGMAAYTFADQAIAVMGNDEKLLERVKKAGEETGERAWELPLWEEYGEQIKGHHSDLLNVGGPYGGTITAAMFLKEFVPDKTPWAHLDIAGVAWCASPRYDCPKGATGAAVRLFVNLLSNWK